MVVNMNSDTILISWGVVAVGTVGAFLLFILIKDWWQSHRHRPDPLQPVQEYTAERFSLRKWK